MPLVRRSAGGLLEVAAKLRQLRKVRLQGLEAVCGGPGRLMILPAGLGNGQIEPSLPVGGIQLHGARKALPGPVQVVLLRQKEAQMREPVQIVRIGVE